MLPRAALTERPELSPDWTPFEPPTQPFADPDPFQELTFPSPLAAKQAIADYLAMPLGRLAREQIDALNELLASTLEKQAVFDYVRRHLQTQLRG